MSYTYTKARIFQWMGILLSLGIIAVGYWYYRSQASTLNQSQNDHLANSGLILLWSFNGDDTSSTTATDRSTTGANGTLTGSPTITAGRSGQALNFDGTDDYVTVADNNTLDAGDTADLTITGWFNRDTFTTDDTVIAKRNGIISTDTGYLAYIDDATDQIIFEVSDGTDEYSLTSKSTFTSVGWNHFAIVWDQDSAANSEIYINGVANTATDSGTIGNIGDLSNALAFRAAAESDAGNPFDGKLDEIRIYSRTLSVGEVKSLYDVGQADKVNSSVSQPQGTGRLDSGLVNYWKFDENTGTSTTDSSTNAFTGTLTNGPTWTTGQVGSAINFDGSNDYVTVTDSDDSKYTGELTICTWANIETAGNYRHFAGKHAAGGGSTNPFDFRTSADNPPKMVLVRANADYRSYDGPNTTLGQWKHYCVVAPAAIETTPTFYIDGVPTTGTASGGGGTGAATGSGAAIRMGSRADATPLMDGSLDEMRIYNRMLSDDEIGQIYRLGAGGNSTGTDTSLKGYWSFNGQDLSGTSAYDRSGAGNTGTLTGGPIKVTGRVGQGLDLDGTDDYVSVADNAALDMGDTDDLTVTGWLYRDSYSTNDVVVAKRTGMSVLNTGYALVVNNSDELFFEVADGSNEYSVISGPVFTGPGWYHVAAVWDQDSASGTELYIDGVPINATDAGAVGNIGSIANSEVLAIGAESDAGEPFDGKLDEIRVYKRALGTAEVKGLYDAGASDKSNSSISQSQGTGRLDSGLAGYWKLDDGSGTSATDSSTNANTGTLTNGPAWTTGQIGGAVDFDETDDYITVADTDTLDITDGTHFTLSGWFNRDTFAADHTIIAKRNGLTAGDTGYVVYIDDTNDDIVFEVSDGTDEYSRTSTRTFTSTGWNHFAAVFDDVVGMSIYVNGAINQDSASGTLSSIGSLANAVAFRMGAESDAGAPFDGKLDEVRLYHRALGSDEVANLYRLTTPTGVDTGLNGYWSFNAQDMSGATAYDRSGAGNKGTLTNGPTLTIGKIGQALSLDGSNDYVSIADSASLDIGDTDDFTVTGWFHRTATGTGDVLFAKRNGPLAAQAGYESHILSSNDKITFEVSDGTDEYSLDSTSTFTTTTNAGWNHFAIVWDQDSAANTEIYVNGVADSATDTGTIGNIGDLSNAVVLAIGAESDNATNFPGKLDEFRFYKRALTAAEIVALYNQSR